MLQKIRSFPLAVYVAVKGAARDLKKDERGLSGVVVAVLLTLISVLAVTLIWGFMEGWLQELWARIFGEGRRI